MTHTYTDTACAFTHVCVYNLFPRNRGVGEGGVEGGRRGGGGGGRRARGGGGGGGGRTTTRDRTITSPRRVALADGGERVDKNRAANPAAFDVIEHQWTRLPRVYLYTYDINNNNNICVYNIISYKII